MSTHSYSRCWIHLVWTTLNRERMLFGPAAARVSAHLTTYAESKGIFVKINYVNSEHVHALIDLPTKYSMEQTLQLLKGGTSHWINEQKLVTGRFAWGRGYGAFSVSESKALNVCRYIAGQEGHHRLKPFSEEFLSLLKKHDLKWHDDNSQ